MARWEPDARGRLEQAAMELYREHGFDRTTVADIAARAGLTERTFFRYFADKREVLFWGAGRLQQLLVDQVAGAPDSASPLDAVTAALEATASFFEERRELARARHALIGAHAELRERELIKLASLASAMGEALRQRGVPAPASSLAAEAGIAVFKIAFDQWVIDAGKKDFAHHVREALRALRAITAGTGKGARAAGAGTGERGAAGKGARPVATGKGARPAATGKGARPAATGKGERPVATGTGARPAATGKAERAPAPAGNGARVAAPPRSKRRTPRTPRTPRKGSAD